MRPPEPKRGSSKGKDPGLTQLKSLSAGARAEIYGWKFEETPAPTNAELRERIAARHGVELRRDNQLSAFWQWQWRQAQYDNLGEMASQDEEMLAQKFPGVSRDKLREATILRLYALADLDKDPKLGLKVLSADLKDSVDRRSWEQYRANQKSKLDVALDELAEVLRKHPDLLAEYQTWRARLNERLEAAP